MGKSGTSDNPIRIRVNNENRMEEVVGICEKNNWKFICGIEPDHPEDISELEYMLNPKSFGGKRRTRSALPVLRIIKEQYNHRNKLTNPT